MTAISAKTVLLFGEVLVDIFNDRKVLGGAPFNVARHLHAFGLHPVLLTRIGDDDLSHQLLSLINSLGMDDRGIQRDALHPTGQVLVHLAESEHRFEILPEQAYDYIHAGMAHMVSSVVRPQLLYFGTLAQRHAISAQALAMLMQSSQAAHFLDINLRSPWYDRFTIEHSLKRANRVKINHEELEIVADMLQIAGKDSMQKAAVLIKRFTLDSLWVTCGENGAWQLDSGGNLTTVAECSSLQALQDTVGAGDGFAAVCILGLLRCWPATITLPRANAFAAALCSIRGAIPDSAEFYQPFAIDWKL